MSENGKGDRARPLSVSNEIFSNNWHKIFSNKTCEYSGLPSMSIYESDSNLKMRLELELFESYVNLLGSGMFFELYPDLSGVWGRILAGRETLRRGHC